MRFIGTVMLLTPLVTAAEPTGKPWRDMDYGSFLSAAIEAPFPDKNIATKGIAIPLRSADGSAPGAMLFDTDLLRWAAGWTEGFVDLKGVVFDGEHWAYPRIKGRQIFGAPVLPGWARQGSFADPRQPPYGPLPGDWARWQGLYTHGEQVVLSYRVGAVRILEHPGLERGEKGLVFVRSIELQDANATDLEVLVLEAPVENAPSIAIVDPTARARLQAATPGRQVVKILAGAAPFSFKILISASQEITVSPAAPTALTPFLRGGPARWARDVVTRGHLGADEGPFAVDRITAPDDNPWRSWMRFGGFDFLDSTTCVLSTWNGDVWTVHGVDDDLEQLRWRRIAAGLHQPLGVRVRDGQIFVVGRDQITRLVDLNGDGETDFYESFNNDHQNTEHFHEFAMDLQTDAEGNFYYMKGARHARDSVVPQHGTLLKVSRDGTRTEFLANGFRAPNGLCVTPTGELYSTDQQGHWIPANRINRLERDSFHGNMFSYHRGPRPTKYDEPLCWIHPSVDRSPSTIVHVDSQRWGPLAGKLLSISYGMGQVFVVPEQRVAVEGKGVVIQGGVVKLPLEFDTGICRGRFNARDGQLYLSGLFGWAGNKTRPGGFFRVRATGKPMGVPIEFHAFEGGLDLVFPEKLDAEAVRQPGNYAVQCWNYRWSKEYGSPDLRLDGREGRDTLEVAAADLLPDGQTIRLSLPGLRPVMQIHVEMRLRANTGAPIKTALHATLQALAPRPRTAVAATPVPAPSPAVSEPRRAQGLILTVQSAAQAEDTVRDVRTSRLAALYVPQEQRPTVFVEPGPFLATWTGFLELELNETVVFAVDCRGKASLSIDGTTLLDVTGEGGPSTLSAAATLTQGLNRIKLEYRSPPTGDAWIRLYWRVGQAPLEPVTPTALAHDAEDALLVAGQTRRRGRELMLEHGCQRCHHAETASAKSPEVIAAGLSLAEAGSMWNEEWLSRWIENPSSLRPDTHMPSSLPGDAAERARAARDVARYLSTLRAPSVATPGAASPETRTAGGELWATLGCFACHSLPGEPHNPSTGNGKDDDRLSLAAVGAKWQPTALVNYLRAPSRHHPRTRMPDFQLTATEAEALAAFLLAAASTAATAAPGQKPALEPGDAERGRKIATAQRCAACHELPGVAAPASATSLERLAAGVDRGCLAIDPGVDGAPDFHLTAMERQLMASFLKNGAPSLAEESSTELAARRLRELQCRACHERDGVSDSWTALTPEPDVEVIDPTQPQTIHRQRPSLSWAGEKLQPEWTRELLAGRLGYKARARAPARMPVFATAAAEIAGGLAHEHGFRDLSDPRAPAQPHLREIGQQLTLATGFVCVQCHPVQGQPALAGPDTETIDFSRITHRLRPHYYSRFLHDPGRLQPGSMMPRYTSDDGKSVLTRILNGDAAQQFDAIWHYLQSIESNR